MAQVILKATLHATAAGVMAFGYHSLQTPPLDSLVRGQYGGHFQFLTIQGQVSTYRVGKG